MTSRRLPMLLALLSASSAWCASEVVAQSSTDETIAHVVAGLRSTIHVSGRPTPPTFRLSERMQRYRVPGVSVAVVDEGRIEWARGFGTRRFASELPVTAATLFQAASISKPVTATAMLRLVQEGALDLDTPVERIPGELAASGE